MTQHNWLDGLKRIPLHLGTFGTAGFLAVHFTPPPFNFAIAGGLAVWRAVAEHSDYTGKRDTGPKAVVDFASQVAGAFAGLVL